MPLSQHKRVPGRISLQELLKGHTTRSTMLLEEHRSLSLAKT
jgi:hypothetical protein